jgi:hypothetical protein
MIHHSFSLSADPAREPVLHLSAVGKDGLNGMYTILHRALNCWAEAPQEFHQLFQDLLKAHPEAKLLPFNPPGLPRQRAE